MTSIEIYTKPNCPRCVSAKKRMDACGFEFREINIGTDVTREDVLAAFPDQRQVPILTMDGNVVPSVNDLGDCDV